jgi:hypothetical protein
MGLPWHHLDVEPVVLEEGVPSGHASIQVSWLFPECKICMVHDHRKGVSGKSQVLSPMFERFDYSEQLSFVDVIVMLC